MKPEYIAPTYNSKRFTCPLCQTLAHVGWSEWEFVSEGSDEHQQALNLRRSAWTASWSRCASCCRRMFWVNGKLVYPEVVEGPPPEDNMPAEVLEVYEEARAVTPISARAAAALYRLALELLCRHLGKEGRLDKMIAQLVADGVPEYVQQCTDLVRITGNDGVHAGEILADEDKAAPGLLADMINLVVAEMIGRRQRVDELYKKLPEGKRKYIEQRNSKAGAAPQPDQPPPDGSR